MTLGIGDLQTRYRRALAAYVYHHDEEDEEPLIVALEIGRIAVRDGHSLLDLLSVHHAVMPSFLAQAPVATDLPRRFARAEQFLAQAVVPFEMTHRGWQETVAQLRKLNETLERQVAERTDALSQSEARLDRAQRIAGIGSWELDMATGAYVWSRALYRLLGRSVDPPNGASASFLRHVTAEDQKRVAAWLADLEAGREREPIDFEIRHADGRTRVVNAQAALVRDPAGVARGVAGTLQDVTERRLTEQQLAQAQKMEAIGNLTGGMAHDFNNLLLVIVGNLDILNDSLADRPDLTGFSQTALDAAMQGAELTRRLLAFARRQPLQAVRFDVNARVEGITKLLGRLLGESVTIRLDCAPDVGAIVADPAQFEAALTNLATNARDAMPKGGRLTFATYNRRFGRGGPAPPLGLESGDYVVVEARDTGIGMTPEVASRVFEPFFTTKAQGKGTGLGLSMVFGFVTQSGGHVAVDSAPGEGTTFRLYLPRDGAGEPAADAAPRRSAAPRGAETVLVVEDNTGIRALVLRQLAELGYRVIEAESAVAALEWLDRGEAVDLLFTDVVMPGGIDGFDLARTATLRRPSLKVLFTSGFTEAGEADCQAIVPGSRLLRKPYRKEQLARLLRDVLERGAEGAAPEAR